MTGFERAQAFARVSRLHTFRLREGGMPFCNVDLGAATMVGIKLGVESYRQNKTMLWDSEEQRLKS